MDKRNTDNLLEIRNLAVEYRANNRIVKAVNHIDLTIGAGKTLGLVGETGAGKTTTALSIMGLLPDPPAKIVSGEILYKGEDLLTKSESDMRKIRGNEISMIFQDPMTALNPIIRVSDQIAEVIQEHDKCTRQEASIKALQMLEMVGIDAERGLEYPHQFSGGMKQRVVIAIALACSPHLLIADEPTTALDVTIQAQVLELMNNLKNEYGTSMLMITHDMGVVCETCDDVAIMYAGEIVEYGSLEDIFDRPQHPYTRGLFESLPGYDTKVRRLKPILGLMPDPADLPTGCYFHPRCPVSVELCHQKAAGYIEVGPGHFVKCHSCQSNGSQGEEGTK